MFPSDAESPKCTQEGADIYLYIASHPSSWPIDVADSRWLSPEIDQQTTAQTTAFVEQRSFLRFQYTNTGRPRGP